jgi:hypothetical protein
MAYKINPMGLIRDKAYPSEIAAERPLCATRIHCEEENESHGSSIRGSSGESMCERFQRQLRGGHSQEERD